MFLSRPSSFIHTNFLPYLNSTHYDMVKFISLHAFCHTYTQRESGKYIMEWLAVICVQTSFSFEWEIMCVILMRLIGIHIINKESKFYSTFGLALCIQYWASTTGIYCMPCEMQYGSFRTLSFSFRRNLYEEPTNCRFS